MSDSFDEFSAAFARSARLIAAADGLLITAGAGLGVDSGLPDFRGSEGMWRAYPALGRARMHFQDIACPDAFRANPRLAWGFYGHRLKLYRETPPGPSFAILQAIAARMRDGAQVFTSNVDGHFQAAGYAPERIVECHGSIHHLQCLNGCMGDVWSAEAFRPEVDEAACALVSPFPECPWCGDLARPNILMFGDAAWIDDRTRAQLSRLAAWRDRVERLVVIEIGAGLAIPSVRRFGEQQGVPIIRINPREAATDASRGVALPLNGVAALRGIASRLVEMGFLERPAKA